MAIFLEIEGIKGDAEAEGHKDWIIVNSMQFGVGRAISSTIGTGKEREGSAPSISEVTLSKIMDKASSAILTEALSGVSKLTKIHVTQTHGDQLESFVEYEFEKTLISSYSMSTAGDTPNESFSLNFMKLSMRYIPFDSDHKAGSPLTASYDLATAKKG